MSWSPGGSRSLGLLFLLWHCRKCRGSSCRAVRTHGHGCPALSHLAPPCHHAGLTWLLSEPTRLPSTGANGEVHIRFWGERLSGVSPGRLKATGLACGGDASITSHIHNWVLLLLWLHPFILSGVISPLISSSILGTY